MAALTPARSRKTLLNGVAQELVNGDARARFSLNFLGRVDGLVMVNLGAGDPSETVGIPLHLAASQSYDDTGLAASGPGGSVDTYEGAVQGMLLGTAPTVDCEVTVFT